MSNSKSENYILSLRATCYEIDNKNRQDTILISKGNRFNFVYSSNHYPAVFGDIVSVCERGFSIKVDIVSNDLLIKSIDVEAEFEIKAGEKLLG